MNAADLVDGALELLVVPSFSRIGPEVRSRLDHWGSAAPVDLTGRVVVITGATSGIGGAAARSLAGRGATTVIIGRDELRTRRAVEAIRSETGNPAVESVLADLGDLDQVRHAADAIAARFGRVDVLVHNAGALLHERAETAEGIEVTVASQVAGPFLLTSLLLDQLAEAGPGRVITVSSGGMYAAELTVDGLQMAPDRYDGTKQYALAKRAQVTLNELWAERVPAAEVVFHAMHPGWADTPGVDAALPTFKRVMGPLLRTPASGADTAVWLAGDDGEPLASSGGFWLDRRLRPIHRLPSTRRSDTPARRRELWGWVTAQVDAPPLPPHDAEPSS